MTTADAASADHRLLEYGSAEDFVAGVMPFLFEGLTANEPCLVVASTGNLAAVRDALGSDAGQQVRFADSDTWGSGNVAARVLAVDWAIRNLQAVAGRCRLVEEFTWQGEAQRRQWRRHEAAANLLLMSSHVSVLCTANTRAQPAEFLENLRQTHPIIAPNHPNADFIEPWSYLATMDGGDPQLPAPAEADTSVALDDADLGPMRQRVSAQARAAGLGDYQTQSVALAATEVVANALLHAATAATIMTWTEQSWFVCEVSDTGSGIADPLHSYRPPAPAGGRCGLWLARTFSDELRIISSPVGTIVRMSFLRP
ncbi:MAG TPA: sensor histidine kinase [Pseudonocardiaceae bacterium]